MKLKQVGRPTRKTVEENRPLVKVRKLTDRSEILSYLEEERSYSAVAIAHLEAELSPISKWFVACGGAEKALCLISRSTLPSYLLTLGDKGPLASLMESVPLPGRAFITCQPHHLETVEGHYELEWHSVMKRMAVTRETFSPAMQEATRLRPYHIREVNGLCEMFSTGAFRSYQLRRGVYHGVWRDGQLVAMAGTHLVSPSYGIAYVGNVLTHPGYRNQGLATVCTSAVTADLFDYCTEVVLNVEPQNWPAVQAYAKLGYREICVVVEALGRRRSLVGSIIASVWRRFSPNPRPRLIENNG